MDEYLNKLAKDIELIGAKAKYYESYYHYRKSEDCSQSLSSFLNQVVQQDWETLKKLEQELLLWREQSKANLIEHDHRTINLLNDLIQEALNIYNNLLLESQTVEVI